MFSRGAVNGKPRSSWLLPAVFLTATAQCATAVVMLLEHRAYRDREDVLGHSQQWLLEQ